MKKFILSGLILIPLLAITQIKPSLVEIPVDVFINKGKTTIEDIFIRSEVTKDKVRSLFERKEFFHELTGDEAEFESYWEAFGSQWHWIKFRENESPLLLFLGLNSFTDEREYVEIYDPEKKKNSRLFAEPGRLIAYKRHPLTNELILFSHKYPCCRSASHNIFTIRSIHDDIKVKDRFFIGRDSGDMKGPFFPDSVSFDGKYEKLTERSLLRWSPAVVEENAFEQRAKTNAIIHYEKGAIHKVLAINREWKYVIMYSGIAEERSSVINHVNFKHKGVYGWIKQ